MAANINLKHEFHLAEIPTKGAGRDPHKADRVVPPFTAASCATNDPETN